MLSNISTKREGAMVGVFFSFLTAVVVVVVASRFSVGVLCIQ